MALADVVFEVDAPGTLGAFTRDRDEARGIVRLVARLGERVQILLTLLGVGADPVGVVRGLREELSAEQDGVGGGGFEVRSVTPYSVVLRAEAAPMAVPWLAPVARFLEVFGKDTLLEPPVVQGGKLRVRGVAVQRMDTRRAVERLQELQRQGGWSGFRVVRVGSFDPRTLGGRRLDLLDPDEEDLVRLALAMGYYQSPRRCNLEHIAQRMGLSVSPVHKRLKEVEHQLIHGHLEPDQPAPRPTRRGSRRSAASPPGLMQEVAVRVPAPGFAPAVFTATHAGARVVYQELLDEPGFATHLLVAVAPPAATEAFLHDVVEGPGLASHEVVSRDHTHLAARVRVARAARESATTPAASATDGAERDSGTRHGLGPDPVPVLAAALGRDAYPKPSLCEDGAVVARIVSARRAGEEELATLLGEVAEAHGWGKRPELLRLRDVSLEAELAAMPRPDRITERQEEVLRIAHALGYYRTPRGCTLEDVAGTLGVSANAVHKSLAAAEQRIFQAYVVEGL